MTKKKKSKRGYASWPKDRLRKVAAQGGASVPAEKRGFFLDPEQARAAGRKGGEARAAKLQKRQHRPQKR